MRNSTILANLFPRVRRELLAAILLQADKWWYLTELAAHLSLTPSSLQRDLRGLVDARILEQRREGTRVYFRANRQSPVFPELSGIVEKTEGLPTALKMQLEPFREKIDCAFIYGSVANHTDHSGSDIDLMVIGQAGLAELAPTVRKLEQRFGHEVNVAVFSRSEFRSKVQGGDHFLTTVLRHPKTFVKGDQVDLDRITSESRSTATPKLKKRIR